MYGMTYQDNAGHWQRTKNADGTPKVYANQDAISSDIWDMVEAMNLRIYCTFTIVEQQ